MSYDLVVRGGTIVTAADRVVGDVGIRGGRIVAIGEGLPRGVAELDARGLQVLPGGVDVHTHLDIDLGDMRSLRRLRVRDGGGRRRGHHDDLRLRVAARGLDARADRRGVEGAGRRDGARGLRVPRRRQRRQRGPARRDPAPRRGRLPERQGVHDQGVRDQRRCAAAGPAGRPGGGAVVNVHAENSEMLDLATADMIAAGRWDPRHYAESRPALAEAEATRRAIDYAELTDAEIYVVHMSCRDAVEAVRTARRRGLRVWGETRPIYLGLTQERYAAGGVEAAKLVGAPPLRTAEDQTALWDALRTGDIQAIGSDNCSWTVEQKAVERTTSGRCPTASPASRPRCASSTRRAWSGVASPFRRSWRHSPRTHADLRALPAEGHHRRRKRRRSRAVRSGPHRTDRRAAPPLARGLRPVRGLRRHGGAGVDRGPRRDRGTRGPAPEPAGPGPAPPARARALSDARCQRRAAGTRSARS